MKNLKKRWKIYGIVYFTLLFVLLPSLASAYIDPSVTTYAIQAIVGVAVAAGAFFATYGRRMKKGWMRTLDIDENETRTTEASLEITREDLKEELLRKREERKKQAVPAAKKRSNIKGRIITSLLCGFAPALAIILRPVLSLYRSNEEEFWFPLSDVMPVLFLVFFVFALTAAVVHFFLPDGRKTSLRLWFAAVAAAGTLCVFIQNHFMSSYLPVLTGDPIDWSQYQGWNIASFVLWGGVFMLFTALVFIRPRTMRILGYSLLALLLCAEMVTGTVEAASLTNRNERRRAYFSDTGLFETSTAGNVVVLVSDTFECTYMNMVLEKYPEYRDFLSDCTLYDNVSGVSIYTDYTYPKFLTGADLPLGMDVKDGMQWCFEHQTILDRVQANGWDMGYYTTFSPAKSVEEKIINYSDQPMHPDAYGKTQLTKLLIWNSFFRSAPHFIKQKFIISSQAFELLKATRTNADPYVEDDRTFYLHVRDQGLTPVDSSPRYCIYELWGIHEPSHFNADVEYVTWDEDVPIDDRKVEDVRAQMTILRTYLDQLKAAGTYDDTTVIMTADHGYKMRLWPVLLVKEAHRTEKGFRVDHTPISLQDDYEDLIAALTSGKTFTEAVAAYADESRVRHAFDFRSNQGYQKEVTQRSFVEIQGSAGDPDSYHYVREEYVMNDDFSGRCEVNTPFISDQSSNKSAAIYGCTKKCNVYGHSAVFDAFFREPEGNLTFRAVLKNRTDRPQRVCFSVNGETIGDTVTVEPSPDTQEIRISLPVEEASRVTLEMYIPDAVLAEVKKEVLGWNDYKSFTIYEAGFYSPDP